MNESAHWTESHEFCGAKAICSRHVVAAVAGMRHRPKFWAQLRCFASVCAVRFTCWLRLFKIG